MLDLAIQDLKKIINVFKDAKENMVLISEQIRNLSKEIKPVKYMKILERKHVIPEN